jgi:hypothetical protein
MIATIRAHVPETLNLGHGGNGPLSELALILEYLPKRQPKIVLWVFCEDNDLYEDLEREKRSELMMGYLQSPPKLQDLENRQAEIDEKLRVYFERQMNSIAAAPTWGFHMTRWFTLSEVSLAVYQLRRRHKEDFALFQRILATAQERVSDWNGKLVFVYMPNLSAAGSARSHATRERVLQICSDLKMPVLDIDKRFAAEGSRAKDYFYPYSGAHFTVTGYQRAGELVLDELKRHRILW